MQVIASGTVLRRGADVRITVRLIEVESATQLWNERFEGSMQNALDFEEAMGRRIAESLRVEMTTTGTLSRAPAEAVDLYLRGRKKLRAREITGSDGALALLEGALALAPSFGPALASHALACIHAWFTADGRHERDWQAESTASLERAMRAAPDAADAHLASAIFASHRGDYRGAARALARALEIAPTYADAQYYLGRLQVETGHASEGIGRLNLAAELDPSLSIGMVDVARHHFLAGRPAECHALLAGLELTGERRDIPVLQLRMRIAAWTGDTPALREALRGLRAMQTQTMSVMALYGAALLGELAEDDLEARADDLLARIDNARSAAFVAQLACEARALLGHTESAMKHLRFACNGALADLEWLDHCPALAPLRGEPELPELRDRVRARAAAIWSI